MKTQLETQAEQLQQLQQDLNESEHHERARVTSQKEEEEEARRSTRTDPRAATPLDTLGSADDDPSKASSRIGDGGDVASDPGVGGASSSSEVQHSYQLRSRIPRPPNASMLVAREKRRSVAAENENNQRVSSRLGKLWRSLSVADKEPRQRKAAAAAAVHRRKHLGHVYNPREAQRCKRQVRRTKAIAIKLKNCTSGDEQEQPSISTAVAHGRGTPEFHHHQHPPPQQWSKRHATSAARASYSVAGQGMPLPRLSATRTATASARSAARPCDVHRFPGPLPPSVRGANRENAVPTAQATAARAFQQPETQNALTTLDNQLCPTPLDNEDDSSAGTSSFDQGGIRDTQGFADGTPGQGQPSSSAAGCTAA
nr:transcription factor SOX-9-like [Dermacentor andersoni]